MPSLEELLSRPMDMQGRASFLPFKDSPSGREFATPGILASIVNALTAPGRALKPRLDEDGNPIPFNAPEEAGNLAMIAMGGGAGGTVPRGALGMNVFHGTKNRFTSPPDITKAGSTSGIKNEPVFWVTSSPESAGKFAEMAGGKVVQEYDLIGKNIRTVPYNVKDLTSGNFSAIKSREIENGIKDGLDAIKFVMKDSSGLLPMADEIAVLKADSLRGIK
jgi:hypothetical protein